MDRQPQPHLDPALDALLDEALAADEASPDLQGRVLALTDPAGTALLDEALAPQAPPEGLETRIIERLRCERGHSSGRVIATLGPSPRAWRGYAAAAAVVLSAGLLFYHLGGSPETGLPTQFADLYDPVQEDPALFAFDNDSEIQAQITSIQSQILSVSDESIWGGDDDFQRELWRELAPDEASDVLLF